MRTASSQVLGALLHKDLRSSRWFVAGLILSLLANRLIRVETGVERYLLSLLEYIPTLLAVLWGAANGDRKNSNSRFDRTHLPISSYHLSLVSAVFPAIVIITSVRLLQIYDLAAGAEYPALSLSMLDLLALFALSYFISSVSSSRFAVMVGVSVVVISPFIVQPFQLQPLLDWEIIVGASLSVLLSLMLKGVVRSDTCAELCAAIMLIITVAPSVARAIDVIQSRPKEQFIPHIYTPADKAIKIFDVGTRGSDLSIIQYKNARTGEVYQRRLKSKWHAAWADARGGVCILESDPAGKGARIAWWETRSGSYRTLIRLPLKPNFDTLCAGGHFASADPSGRYLVACLPAIRNSSVDLWLFDLKLKKGQVVLQNAAYFSPRRTRWVADKALIPSYRSRVIEVSTSDWTAEYSDRRAD